MINICIIATIVIYLVGMLLVGFVYSKSNEVMSRQPALDGTGGSHVLKSGRLHRAVHGLELAPPGVVFLLEQPRTA